MKQKVKQRGGIKNNRQVISKTKQSVLSPNIYWKLLCSGRKFLKFTTSGEWKIKGNAELTLEVPVIQQTIASALLLTPRTGFQKIHAFKKHYMTAYYLLELSLISGCKWLSWTNIISYIIMYLLATRLVFLCMVSTTPFLFWRQKTKVYLGWRAQYFNKTLLEAVAPLDALKAPISGIGLLSIVVLCWQTLAISP